MRRAQIDWRSVLDDEDEDRRSRRRRGRDESPPRRRGKKKGSSLGSKLATAATALAIPVGIGLAAYAGKRFALEHGFTREWLERYGFIDAARAMDEVQTRRGAPMVGIEPNPTVDQAADAEVEAPDVPAPPGAAQVGGVPAPPPVELMNMDQDNDDPLADDPGDVEFEVVGTLGPNNEVVPVEGRLDETNVAGVPTDLIDRTKAELNNKVNALYDLTDTALAAVGARTGAALNQLNEGLVDTRAQTEAGFQAVGENMAQVGAQVREVSERTDEVDRKLSAMEKMLNVLFRNTAQLAIESRQRGHLMPADQVLAIEPEGQLALPAPAPAGRVVAKRGRALNDMGGRDAPPRTRRRTNLIDIMEADDDDVI